MTVKAEIIADTIGYHGARITTFQVYAPRFLLAEINTHGVLAKSAASSRAIPVEKRIGMVRHDPYIPKAWGKNQRGMQAEATLETVAADWAETYWRNACHQATFYAQKLADVGLHKQYANRVLEPFAHYLGVLTATEWDNFFHLRNSPHAQPEFEELAGMMEDLLENSTPLDRHFHLPYATDLAIEGRLDINQLYKVSAARCARVSYNTFDGNVSTVEADLKLCDDLLAQGHMSPFDHAAFRDHVEVVGNARMWSQPEAHGRFWGWIPHRWVVEESLGITSRRNSFGAIPWAT